MFGSLCFGNKLKGLRIENSNNNEHSDHMERPRWNMSSCQKRNLNLHVAFFRTRLVNVLIIWKGCRGSLSYIRMSKPHTALILKKMAIEYILPLTALALSVILNITY